MVPIKLQIIFLNKGHIFLQEKDEFEDFSYITCLKLHALLHHAFGRIYMYCKFDKDCYVIPKLLFGWKLVHLLVFSLAFIFEISFIQKCFCFI